ncbi:MAG: amino acid racemase [Parvularcula sp.]|jgi:aspartate racemase|nr:amino acid racemase [Parvularcula sp.]
MSKADNLPTIGILGGTSHVVATRYYDLINEEVRRVLGGHEVAETVMVGMNFGRVVRMLESGDRASLDAYVADKIDGLERAGADLIIGTSNTMHEIVGPLMSGRATPFLPITQPLIDALTQNGARRPAIFGTKATMAKGRVVREVEEALGIEVIVPPPEEQEEIDRVIFRELVHFRFAPEAKDRYRAIASRMLRDQNIDGLILGCTEIYLLIDQSDLPELPIYATAKLHAVAAARWALREAGAL